MKRERALRIVKRFEEFHEAYVNRGGGHPDDIELKEVQYKIEREKLVTALVRAVDIRVG